MRKPHIFEMESLGTGEVGYMVAGIKNVLDARVGDTITSAREREGGIVRERKAFSAACSTKKRTV